MQPSKCKNLSQYFIDFLVLYSLAKQDELLHVVIMFSVVILISQQNRESGLSPPHNAL